MIDHDAQFIRCVVNGESFVVISCIKDPITAFDSPSEKLLRMLGGDGLVFLKPSKMKDFACSVFKRGLVDNPCAGGIAAAVRALCFWKYLDTSQRTVELELKNGSVLCSYHQEGRVSKISYGEPRLMQWSGGELPSILNTQQYDPILVELYRTKNLVLFFSQEKLLDIEKQLLSKGVSADLSQLQLKEIDSLTCASRVSDDELRVVPIYENSQGFSGLAAVTAGVTHKISFHEVKVTALISSIEFHTFEVLWDREMSKISVTFSVKELADGRLLSSFLSELGDP